MTDAQPWIIAYAARNGLTYEPDADERWLRAWEPFVTLKTPIRYEHALLATGASGSITIARFIVEADGGEAGAWVVIAQDLRLGGDARAAATCDLAPDARSARPPVFGDPLDLVTMPRQTTGDVSFDHAFASFAPTAEDSARALTPSLRKLTLSWRIPLHFEVRPGGFIFAPTSLGPDPRSLSWLLGAAQFFGDKAAKRVQ